MKKAFLGIDISKNTFDVAVLMEDKIKTQKFNNNEQGFNKLLVWLNQKEIVLSQACMEATSIYGQALAEFLYAQEIPISVVNPARIKGFSQSELARSKNDILDAKLIARFCKLIGPELWQPTPEPIKILQPWVRRLDDLIAMHRQEENRLEVSDDGLTEANIVYSVKAGNSAAYLYTLVEQQSSVDPMMAFRLLVYIIRIIELHLKQNPGSDLPLVIPIVVYAGDGSWNAPLEIFPLFGELEGFARGNVPPAKFSAGVLWELVSNLIIFIWFTTGLLLLLSHTHFICYFQQITNFTTRVMRGNPSRFMT